MKLTSKITNGITNNQQTTNKQLTTNKNEKNDKNEKNKRSSIEEIVKCYEENIGMITPATSDLLFSYLDDMDYKLIVEAIKRSALANKRSMSYINGILKSWNNKGYKVLADLQDEINNKTKTEKMEFQLIGIQNFDSLYDN